jgi:hypothetical protein
MLSDGRGAVCLLEDAIRAYVLAHPSAADNAAGIQKWWLPPDLANGPTADVEAALAALHVAGVLSELRLPDGSVVYSAATASNTNALAGEAMPARPSDSAAPYGRCKP